jgi:FdhD protein
MPDNGTHRTEQCLASIVPMVAYSESVAFLECRDGETSCASKPVVLETVWSLVVNAEHWLTVLCSPNQLGYFALGFLYNEGLINSTDDVLDLRIGPASEAVIRIELRRRDLRLPQHRTLTSGCGGGITFVDIAAAREPLRSTFRVAAERVSAAMNQMLDAVADDYRRVGGFHTTSLSDGQRLLAMATDIGRHNTLDKVAGICLAHQIPMHDSIMLTSGRVSVEMLGKAARMRVPLVATLNSPTHLAVELARQWRITLIGYARGTKMHIYAGWQRVNCDPISSKVEQIEPGPSGAVRCPCQATPPG